MQDASHGQILVDLVFIARLMACGFAVFAILGWLSLLRRALDSMDSLWRLRRSE